MSDNNQLRLQPEDVLHAVFPFPPGPSTRQEIVSVSEGNSEEDVGGYPGYEEASKNEDAEMSDDGENDEDGDGDGDGDGDEDGYDYDSVPYNPDDYYQTDDDDEDCRDEPDATAGASVLPDLGSCDSKVLEDDHDCTSSGLPPRADSGQYHEGNGADASKEEDAMMLDE